MTALGDRFAGSRLQRLSDGSAESTPPPRIHCPTRDRPEHLWWGYHCRLDKTLQPTYGFNCDDYYLLLALQGGVCGVCGGLPRRWRLVVDHDHQPPYAIRGLVHFTCNRMLGLVGVLAWWLGRMLAYLADPPGGEMGMQVPAAKAKRLEVRAAAKRRRAAARRAQPQQAEIGQDAEASFADRVRAALQQTTDQGA